MAIGTIKYRVTQFITRTEKQRVGKRGTDARTQKADTQR